MSNPVAVEVTRGERVESAHRGAGATVEADGGVPFAPRSRSPAPPNSGEDAHVALAATSRGTATLSFNLSVFLGRRRDPVGALGNPFLARNFRQLTAGARRRRGRAGREKVGHDVQ